MVSVVSHLPPEECRAPGQKHEAVCCRSVQVHPRNQCPSPYRVPGPRPTFSPLRQPLPCAKVTRDPSLLELRGSP